MPRMFTKPTQVSTIWRFYMDQNKQWHWQRIGMDHTVLSESPSNYKTYENCVADAQKNGHVFQPAQAHLKTSKS